MDQEQFELIMGMYGLIVIAVMVGPILVGIAAFFIGRMVQKLSNND